LAGKSDECIVFCQHPAVVTLGRGTEEGDVFSWTGKTIEVSRGGRATYHGPNQLVIYPILDLRESRPNLPGKDINLYLRYLEGILISAFKDMGIESSAKETGIWVGEHKIASIGVAVRKWVSYHGISINVFKDENAFQGINPCGFKSSTMKSLEEILGAQPRISDLKTKIKSAI
jgi:lipoate-protein ligase B